MHEIERLARELIELWAKPETGTLRDLDEALGRLTWR